MYKRGSNSIGNGRIKEKKKKEAKRNGSIAIAREGLFNTRVYVDLLTVYIRMYERWTKR